MANRSLISSQQDHRSFPRPETALAHVIGDPAYRQSFHQRLKTTNRYVVAMYRMGILPLFGAGRTIMLLTTRGRTSGKKRSFPVGYFRIGGQIYLLSGWGKKSNWYKNLLAYPEDVSLQIGFRRFPVRATVLTDPAGITQVLQQLVAESPADAHRLFGWDPDIDRLEYADFDPMANSIVLVRFTPAVK